MKRVFCLLLAALFCLPLVSALAEPRYPISQGAVTDAAAVLSASTVQELRELDKALDDILSLHVVTVDFLDGAQLTDYAEGLREQWDLDSDALLLLMAVGEDKFGLFGGAYVNEHISPSVQQKLLSASFEAPFLRQDYDGAIAALMPALVTEINKVWNADVDISGLFGTVSKTSFSTENDWLDRAVEYASNYEWHDRARDEASDEDFSIGKVILTVILLLIIFGNRGKRRNRDGCGCGCMPFSSLLAGWGLWKLWKK